MCDEDVLWVQLQVLFLASIEQNEAVHQDAGVSGISPRNAFNVSSCPKNREKQEKFSLLVGEIVFAHLEKRLEWTLPAVHDRCRVFAVFDSLNNPAGTDHAHRFVDLEDPGVKPIKDARDFDSPCGSIDRFPIYLV